MNIQRALFRHWVVFIFASFILFARVGAHATEKVGTDQLLCTWSEKLIDQFIQSSKRLPKPTRTEVLTQAQKIGLNEISITLDLEATLVGAAILNIGDKAHKVAYWITDTTIMLVTADNSGGENSLIDRHTGKLLFSLGDGLFLPYECKKQQRKF